MRHYTIKEMEQMGYSDVFELFKGKRLNYNVLEPENGLITVEFSFESNKISVSDVGNKRIIDDFSVEYYYVGENVTSRLNEGNLRYCYLKDVQIYGEALPAIDAFCSFWDGEVSFIEVAFGDGKVNFYNATFGDGNINFVGTEFGNGNVDFAGANFGRGNVDFNTAVFRKGDVDFTGVKFGEGNVNFYGANFGKGNVSFAGAEFGDGYIDFGNARFGKGKVDFASAKFGVGDVNFCGVAFGEGNVDFHGINFGVGNINFYKAEFGEGNVDFHGTNFGVGNASFREAEFGEGNVSFSATEFGKGNANFYKVKFGKGDVDFRGAKFRECYVAFWGAEFGEGYVDFGSARFGKWDVNFARTNFGEGGVSFYGAEFGEGKLDFHGAKFGKGKVHFDNIQIDSIDFNNTKFDYCLFHKVDIGQVGNFKAISGKTINFKNCRFHGGAVFGGIQTIFFYNSIIEKTVEISNCHTISFPKTTNLGIIDLNWDELNLKNSFVGDDKTRQLVLLKENYHNLGQYDWEDKTFVEYMRTKRKQEKNYFKKIVNWFVDIIGEYGTNPGRVAVVMLLTWFLFGMVFEALFQNIFNINFFGNTANNLINMHYGDGFYYSAITFLTMSYNIIPVHPAIKILAPIEGILGLFLMSYFTVALVRKTLR